ncbi:hypothetical protein AYK24_02935 [Thermoplasmatales archaeon SG8-52-4]|nr:MAG: hypothetical protein AYK24_02935 [Thermoplasmatales archaeon SG8-52-4]
MRKVFIYGKVCERRNLDAEKISLYFKKNNYDIVNKPRDADIIILVTCAALKYRTDFALTKIKELQKYKAELIVAGCLPDIKKEEVDNIFNGKLLPIKNLEIIDNFFPKNKIKFNQINDQNILFDNIDESHLSDAFKKILKQFPYLKNTYVNILDIIYKSLYDEKLAFYRMSTKKPLYHIRTSWGCLGNCSYCAIKRATGSLRSKPLIQCVNELKNGLDKGYKNFILLGSDVGAYGLDSNSNFPELLSSMIKINGDFTLYIDSLNPHWIIKYIDDLEKIIKRGKINSLEIPIQSGNNRILKLMHRFSDVEKMKEVLLRLKKAYPNLLIRTHVIIGFPTETDEEFKETLSFIKAIDINAGLLYPFSSHQDTIAEKIEPKISQNEIIRRLEYAKANLKDEGYHIYPKSSGHFFLFEKKKSF